jgi:hypothetical protein
VSLTTNDPSAYTCGGSFDPMAPSTLSTSCRGVLPPGQGIMMTLVVKSTASLTATGTADPATALTPPEFFTGNNSLTQSVVIP